MLAGTSEGFEARLQSFVMPVSSSVRVEQLGSHWTDFFNEI
jgi:hypothetical protein